MAVPTITSVTPAQGPSDGNELVHIVGSDFADAVAVTFGGELAETIRVRPGSGNLIVDVLTPPHELVDGGGAVVAELAVDVTLQNLDSNGDPVPGEVGTIVLSYTYQRADLLAESNLQRCVRALLRGLKRSVLANTALTVSVDWDYTSPDEVLVAAGNSAQLPALVLTGPEFTEARDSADNVTRELAVTGPSGPEIRILREPYVVDLLFDLIGVADNVQHLYNLITAVAEHYHREQWVYIDRDATDPSKGQVRFEVDLRQTHRTRLRGGKDDVRTFTWNLRVRGFWLVGDTLPRDVTVPVDVVQTVVEQN